MKEMVERVARALREDMPYLSNPEARSLARTAIEAMREPTEAMKEAGTEFIYEGWASKMEGQKAIAAESWKTMIDAALK